ncbi:hypothetical protein MPSEU_000620800 [Mayamaea pseudoterrestris]|nr:hypothetical protein MPSEU_000620800 [Mayamaea pseudoterrestris]
MKLSATFFFVASTIRTVLGQSVQGIPPKLDMNDRALFREYQGFLQQQEHWNSTHEEFSSNDAHRQRHDERRLQASYLRTVSKIKSAGIEHSFQQEAACISPSTITFSMSETVTDYYRSKNGKPIFRDVLRAGTGYINLFSNCNEDAASQVSIDASGGEPNLVNVNPKLRSANSRYILPSILQKSTCVKQCYFDDDDIASNDVCLYGDCITDEVIFGELVVDVTWKTQASAPVFDVTESASVIGPKYAKTGVYKGQLRNAKAFISVSFNGAPVEGIPATTGNSLGPLNLGVYTETEVNS